MRLHARALPKLRDQTVRHLTDPSKPVRAKTGAANQPGLDVAANHLRVGDLYWVTADMAALAMSAGSQLAAARWATADRPSPCGLIVFDGGVGQLDVPGGAVPIDACTWGPAEDGCAIGLFVDRNRLDEALAESGAELVRDDVPPLVPVRSFVLPVTAEPQPFAALPADAPMPVLAALAAAWLLMQQPQLVERSAAEIFRSDRKEYALAGKPPPEVTVIDLRHLYKPQVGEENEPARGRYRHRWVVSGHWRNAWRPSAQEHRKVWIPAHLKGPEGAPLLATERVNVWRR